MLAHHPHYTGDHIFNYDKLEYYENGEPVYGISLKTVDTFDKEDNSLWGYATEFYKAEPVKLGDGFKEASVYATSSTLSTDL